MHFKKDFKLDMAILSLFFGLVLTGLNLSHIYHNKDRPTAKQLADQLCNRKGYFGPSFTANDIDDKTIKILCR